METLMSSLPYFFLFFFFSDKGLAFKTKKQESIS